MCSGTDPSGETIANDFLHYLVRDCEMDEEQLTAWKFAITRGQVRVRLATVLQGEAERPHAAGVHREARRRQRL